MADELQVLEVMNKALIHAGLHIIKGDDNLYHVRKGEDKLLSSVGLGSAYAYAVDYIKTGNVPGKLKWTFSRLEGVLINHRYEDEYWVIFPPTYPTA